MAVETSLLPTTTMFWILRAIFYENGEENFLYMIEVNTMRGDAAVSVESLYYCSSMYCLSSELAVLVATRRDII